jgi:predicted acylesterase/phospholipase RssA
MCTLTTGDPIAAILASSAYPGVFPIQRINGRLLVDGGVTRNFPADVLRHSSELDFIIGTSIYMVPKMPPRQRGGKLSRLQTMIRSIDILVQESNNQQTALCDFSFIAPVEIYRQYDLEHVRNICELGRIYAHEEIDRLVDTLQQHGWENYYTASTQAA